MSSEMGEAFHHEGRGAESGERVQASTDCNTVGNDQIVPEMESETTRLMRKNLSPGPSPSCAASLLPGTKAEPLPTAKFTGENPKGGIDLLETIGSIPSNACESACQRASESFERKKKIFNVSDDLSLSIGPPRQRASESFERLKKIFNVSDDLSLSIGPPLPTAEFTGETPKGGIDLPETIGSIPSNACESARREVFCCHDDIGNNTAQLHGCVNHCMVSAVEEQGPHSGTELGPSSDPSPTSQPLSKGDGPGEPIGSSFSSPLSLQEIFEEIQRRESVELHLHDLIQFTKPARRSGFNLCHTSPQFSQNHRPRFSIAGHLEEEDPKGESDV